MSNENLLIFEDDTTWKIIAGFLFYWKFTYSWDIGSLVISNLDLLISTRLEVIGNFYFIRCFYMLELSWIFAKCKVIIV